MEFTTKLGDRIQTVRNLKPKRHIENVLMNGTSIGRVVEEDPDRFRAEARDFFYPGHRARETYLVGYYETRREAVERLLELQ